MDGPIPARAALGDEVDGERRSGAWRGRTLDAQAR
jgi:hypothetical protein